VAERDERVGDEARLRRVRVVLGMAVGDAAEIFERLEIVLGHAVAFGVHAPEFPLRQRVALFGGVFERVDGLGLLAGFQPMRAGFEGFHRRQRRRGRHRVGGFAAVERHGHLRRH
jgi:hypothetical protein